MQIGRVIGATRVLGKSQGYMGLPLRDERIFIEIVGAQLEAVGARDEKINCKVNGHINSMLTAWLPTPDELSKLNSGAPVYVRILGTQHPPIIVGVGGVPK